MYQQSQTRVGSRSKTQGITRASRIHRLGTMDIYTTVCAHQSFSTQHHKCQSTGGATRKVIWFALWGSWTQMAIWAGQLIKVKCVITYCHRWRTVVLQRCPKGRKGTCRCGTDLSKNHITSIFGIFSCENEMKLYVTYTIMSGMWFFFFFFSCSPHCSPSESVLTQSGWTQSFSDKVHSREL